MYVRMYIGRVRDGEYNFRLQPGLATEKSLLTPSPIPDLSGDSSPGSRKDASLVK